MTTRRDFIRRGALWVAGAALVEPVARKLWAFPTNPLGVSRTNAVRQGEILSLRLWGDGTDFGGHVAVLSNGDAIAHGVVRDVKNGILVIDWV